MKNYAKGAFVIIGLIVLFSIMPSNIYCAEKVEEPDVATPKQEKKEEPEKLKILRAQLEEIKVGQKKLVGTELSYILDYVKTSQNIDKERVHQDIDNLCTQLENPWGKESTSMFGNALKSFVFESKKRNPLTKVITSKFVWVGTKEKLADLKKRLITTKEWKIKTEIRKLAPAKPETKTTTKTDSFLPKYIEDITKINNNRNLTSTQRSMELSKLPKYKGRSTTLIFKVTNVNFGIDKYVVSGTTIYDGRMFSIHARTSSSNKVFANINKNQTIKISGIIFYVDAISSIQIVLENCKLLGKIKVIEPPAKMSYIDKMKSDAEQRKIEAARIKSLPVLTLSEMMSIEKKLKFMYAEANELTDIQKKKAIAKIPSYKGRRCEITFSVTNVKEKHRYRNEASEPIMYIITGTTPFGLDSIGVDAYTIDKMCVDINKDQRIKVIGIWGGRLFYHRREVALEDCEIEVLKDIKPKEKIDEIGK